MTRLCAVAVVVCLAGCKKSPPEPPASGGPVEAPPMAVVQAAPKSKPQLDLNASLATVHCGDDIGGSGFFFSPSRLLTRSDFVCESHDPPRVRLPDGRTQLGKVLWRDDVLVAAILEVAEGSGEPLPLGDSGAIALNGMLAQGKLSDDVFSELARHHFVITYPKGVPAPGLPVLDADGRAVAMVARRLDAASVLAIPLPVVAEAGGPLPGPWEKWAQVEVRARPAAETELNAARDALHGVLLASAIVDSEQHLFLVLARDNDGQHGRFIVSMEGCTYDAPGAPWTDFDAQGGVDRMSKRVFSYLHRAHLDAKLEMALMPVEPCKVGAGTVVNVGTGRFHSAMVAQVDHRLSPSVARAEVELLPASSPPSPGAYAAPSGAELQWRERYTAARKAIDDVEADLEAERQFIARCDALVASRSPQTAMMALNVADKQHYEAAKEKLEHADELRAQVRSKLDDLDRAAANAAVPLEWRR